MGLPPSQLLNSPYWWASHLVESACSSDDQAYEYICKAFGLNDRKFASYWTDTLNMDSESGPWPQFELSIPGFSVRITYSANSHFEGEGTSPYDIEYALSTLEQTHWAGGLAGGGVSAQFRWDEIERFSRLTSARETSLLLLLPACEIPAHQREEAANVIGGCFKALGYDGPLIQRFSAALAACRDYGWQWHYDEHYGWLADHWHCWRSRGPRPTAGLTVPPEEHFFLFKSLTDYLGLK